MYNFLTGKHLYQTQEFRYLAPSRTPFLEILDEQYLLLIDTVHFEKEHSECFIYRYNEEKLALEKTFYLRHSAQALFCVLPQRSFALYDKHPNRICIYRPLESTSPRVVAIHKKSTHNVTFFHAHRATPWIIAPNEQLELATSEEILAFVAKHEKNELSTQIMDVHDRLSELRFFPPPIQRLITAYSISSETLAEAALDEFVYKQTL